ncbi:MAG: hypothetical protein P8I80_02945 [Bacteroidales bacterium]|jgi:phenylacetate-CoA ligase|nr:hypothetical protein [Bacteroidales bacterium]
MSIYNIVSEKLILPLHDAIKGVQIYKDLKELNDTQWLPENDLLELQNERLRILINEAYNNVPYYRELFDKIKLKPSDIKNSLDLYKIPILTKEDIRTNIKNRKLIATNIPQKDLIKIGTSGSTGEPMQYFTTRRAYSYYYASAIRTWYWAGYKLGDKYIKISVNPRASLTKKIQDRINRSRYLHAPQFSEQFLKKIIEEINDYNPKIIRAYPETFEVLSSYLNNNNIDVYKPKGIISTGSILFSETRNRTEEVFGCKVYNGYSCEGGVDVGECSTHECSHAAMEIGITELLSDGKEVESGERGRVITTDLFNYAMPFIRYDTQDYVYKSNNDCSCGRKLLQIDRVDGRDSDILVTPNRNFVHLHIFTGYFGKFKSVNQFQIRQIDIDVFILLLVVNESFNQEIHEKIFVFMKQTFKGSKITLEIVDNIPLTPTGKRRFLIRNLDINLYN